MILYQYRWMSAIFGLTHRNFLIVSIGVLLVCAWEWSELSGIKKLIHKIFYLIIFALIMIVGLAYPIIVYFFLSYGG